MKRKTRNTCAVGDAPQRLVALVVDAIQYVASLQSDQPRPITVTIADQQGRTVTVVTYAAAISSTARLGTGRVLNHLERAIVEAVRHSQDALRGKQLAAHTGKRYTSNFRESLSKLCHQQVLRRTSTGYVLSDPHS
jgi:hypothetical protein